MSIEHALKSTEAYRRGQWSFRRRLWPFAYPCKI